MKPKSIAQFAAVPATLLATLTFSSLSYAAPQTWKLDGTNNIWNLDSLNLNWDTGLAWLDGSTAVFNGTGEAIDMTAGINAAGLTFGGNGYSIGSSNASVLTLTAANVDVSNASDTATIGSAIAGTVGLTKAGAGMLVLTGANTYGGGTNITAGTLQIGDGTVNGIISGTYDIASGATLRLARTAKTTVTNNSITGAGTVSLYVAGASNGTSTYQWDAFTTFNSSFTGKLVVEEGRVFLSQAQLGGTSAIEIQNGAQFLATGSGTTYNQAITLSGLGYGENGLTNGGLRLAANAGTVTWAGAITLAADSGIMAQRGNTTATNFNLTGSITGDFDCRFHTGDTQSSTGSTITVTPTAAVQNSYRSTTISGGSAGSIVAGNQYAFSTGGMKVLGATLKSNGYNFSFANLSGTGGTIGNYHATNASTLTVGSDNTSTSSAAVMTNGGAASLALTKVGSGTLTLTGNNSYTGGTNINQGTLQANHASALGTGNVTIDGGNLTTTVGNLGTGALSLTSGSLALNSSTAGTASLGLNQDFTMSGGQWTIDLAAGLDQIIGNGVGADFSIIGGTLDLGGGTINYGATYNLLSGFNTGSVSGLTITNYDTTNFTATLGNNGVLSFVPEPSVALLGGLGALVLLRRRRD